MGAQTLFISGRTVNEPPRSRRVRQDEASRSRDGKGWREQREWAGKKTRPKWRLESICIARPRPFPPPHWRSLFLKGTWRLSGFLRPSTKTSHAASRRISMNYASCAWFGRRFFTRAPRHEQGSHRVAPQSLPLRSDLARRRRHRGLKKSNEIKMSALMSLLHSALTQFSVLRWRVY